MGAKALENSDVSEVKKPRFLDADLSFGCNRNGVPYPSNACERPCSVAVHTSVHRAIRTAGLLAATKKGREKPPYIQRMQWGESTVRAIFVLLCRHQIGVLGNTCRMLSTFVNSPRDGLLSWENILCKRSAQRRHEVDVTVYLTIPDDLTKFSSNPFWQWLMMLCSFAFEPSRIGIMFRKEPCKVQRCSALVVVVKLEIDLVVSVANTVATTRCAFCRTMVV